MLDTCVMRNKENNAPKRGLNQMKDSQTEMETLETRRLRLHVTQDETRIKPFSRLFIRLRDKIGLEMSLSSDLSSVPKTGNL